MAREARRRCVEPVERPRDRRQHLLRDILRLVEREPAAPGQRDVLATSLRVSSLGELLNPPPPPRPSNGTCSRLANTDVDDDGVEVAGASLDECCRLCWADATQRCLSAAFNAQAPACWLKFGKDFVQRSGVETCVLDLPN